MKKIVAILLILVMSLLLISCGKTWTCDECGKTWTGKAYYGYDPEMTLCEDCAREHWIPLPYQNYVKR